MRAYREPIPYEGALLRAVARVRMDVAGARMLARIAVEVGEPLTGNRRPTAAGDPQRLRGIPCVGRGISGTAQMLDGIGVRIVHIRTLSARELQAFQIRISSEYDGTSPGTQPEEETVRRSEAKAA